MQKGRLICEFSKLEIYSLIYSMSKEAQDHSSEPTWPAAVIEDWFPAMDATQVSCTEIDDKQDVVSFWYGEIIHLSHMGSPPGGA